MILVDTNVLLRLIQIGHPHQQPAIDAIGVLRLRDREQFLICPQILYEMYAVCTRPTDVANPGLGLTPVAAMVQIETAERQFPVEHDTDAVLPRWKEMVVRYGVSGKATHDARLAALMISRKIPRILTFNDAHFVRYGEIRAVNPFDVLGVARK